MAVYILDGEPKGSDEEFFRRIDRLKLNEIPAGKDEEAGSSPEGRAAMERQAALRTAERDLGAAAVMSSEAPAEPPVNPAEAA